MSTALSTLAANMLWAIGLGTLGCGAGGPPPEPPTAHAVMTPAPGSPADLAEARPHKPVEVIHDDSASPSPAPVPAPVAVPSGTSSSSFGSDLLPSLPSGLPSLDGAIGSSGAGLGAGGGGQSIAGYQAQFVRACAGGTSELEAFCGCIWTNLSKQIAASGPSGPSDPAALVRDFRAKGAAKGCYGRIPEDAVKRWFTDSCAKQPGYGKFCDCAWKEMRARVKVEDLADVDLPDTPEIDQARRAAGKACSALKPH